MEMEENTEDQVYISRPIKVILEMSELQSVNTFINHVNWAHVVVFTVKGLQMYEYI